MKIVGASAKLSPAYSAQVDSDTILDALPRFDEYMAIDYALAATDEALAQAGITGNDIDLIISMSISPDHLSDKVNIVGPRLCHPLQRELGSRNAVVFDLHDACWSFALDTARSFIHEMGFKHALIVRADCVNGLNTEHAGALAWGDGAGALIVKHSDNNDWKVGFTRLSCAEKAARVELLDARVRFRGDFRAALYFSVEASFTSKLTDAVESLVSTFSDSWTPFIEPWQLAPEITTPQLAPYAFPLSLSDRNKTKQFDGLISFDPFRMHLGACKVNVS